MDYSLAADLLNKFSQLTPWIQAIALLVIPACVGLVSYFTKEAITAWPRSRAAIYVADTLKRK